MWGRSASGTTAQRRGTHGTSGSSTMCFSSARPLGERRRCGRHAATAITTLCAAQSLASHMLPCTLRFAMTGRLAVSSLRLRLAEPDGVPAWPAAGRAAALRRTGWRRPRRGARRRRAHRAGPQPLPACNAASFRSYGRAACSQSAVQYEFTHACTPPRGARCMGCSSVATQMWRRLAGCST
jgi:hypothetical protein